MLHAEQGLSEEGPYLYACMRAHLVKNLPAMWETWFRSQAGKLHWRRDRLPTPVFLGFPGGWAGKESACNVGDRGSIPGLGRSPREGKGYPLQYSGLEHSVDCIIHGSQSVGHNWATFTFTGKTWCCLVAYINKRRRDRQLAWKWWLVGDG